MDDEAKTFDTAARRWEGVGPYYAMFPTHFSESVISEYTCIGSTVLDPFAGRGTSTFSACTLGRHGIGVEISPVGWVYAKAKLRPAPLDRVEKRLVEIERVCTRYTRQAQCMPTFFRMCYSLHIRRFLLAARSELDWRRSACDRTLMAILLVYLHGKIGQSLSNQMRQTKAMSPQYAIKWWIKNGSRPPDIQPVEFLQKRIHWRYEKGVVDSLESRFFLGNSLSVIPRLVRLIRLGKLNRASLLFTSPPYFGFTNYHYDQWIRLWLLGYELDAYVARGPYQGRFTNSILYPRLLEHVFCRSASLITEDAVIYVRTSNDPFTRSSTVNALITAFPNKLMTEVSRPFHKPTQTHLFGDKSPKSGEVDLILLPS